MSKVMSAVLLVLAMLTAPAPAQVRDPSLPTGIRGGQDRPGVCDPGWKFGLDQGIPGVGNTGGGGYSVTTWDPDGPGPTPEWLVIGGGFGGVAGDIWANNIAAWDGQAWHDLGGGVQGQVWDMVVFNGDLIAAGSLWQAGPPPPAGPVINGIARYDGTSWHAMDTGFTGPGGASGVVYALTIYQGQLIAAGSFTNASGLLTSNIARWNGAAWEALGFGIDGQQVRALAVLGDDLYAGGFFHTAGAVSASNIARWDGFTWSAMGSGVSNEVYSLCARSNGTLAVGGGFTQAGGVPAWMLAQWAPGGGGAWSNPNPFGAQGLGGTPFVIREAPNGDLLFGGAFQPSLDMRFVAGWHHGSGFYTLGYGTDAAVWDIGVWNGKLVIVGGFRNVGPPVNVIGQPTVAWGVAIFDSSLCPIPGCPIIGGWRRLVPGLDGFSINALCVSRGELFTGGYPFKSAGMVNPDGVARWNGADWNVLVGQTPGPGLGTSYGPAGYSGSMVLNAAVDYQGHLILGGQMQGPPSWAQNISSWSGFLSPWGDVFFDPFNGPQDLNAMVRALTTWDPDGPGVNMGVMLIAGGDFTVAGRNGLAVNASRIAGWHWASHWEAFGTGVNGPVHALTVHKGDLIIGGLFTQADGIPANNIARLRFDPGGPGVPASWVWNPLGSGIDGFVYSLLSHNGSLYVGGQFSQAGGIAAANIARWDGAAWHPVGNGLGHPFNSPVLALTTYRGDLYAGGSFQGSFAPGGGSVVLMSNIGRWDGAAWHPLDGGLIGHVLALAEYQGKLIVGGGFTSVDGRVSHNWARWEPEVIAPAVAQGLSPGTQTRNCGEDAGFGITVVWGTAPSFQWRKNGVPLMNGPTGTGSTIENATTPNMAIRNLSHADAGQYDCVVSNACASVPSDAATLTILYANCDCSTTPPLCNINDFVCFQQRFAAGDAYANCDGSTTPPILNINDFVCFQQSFAAGCP